MREKPRPVTGGCFCGAVRYAAEAYLRSANYCHCANCRRLSGQPVAMGVPVAPGTLRFTQGVPRYFQTSEHAKRGFCEVCGARLVYQPLRPQEQRFLEIETGSLDNPEDVRPMLHMFIESRLPWFDTRDDLPRLRRDETPEDPVARPPGETDGN